MLHLGSLQYLQAARYLADAVGARFALLTGPKDDELAVHGFRRPESGGRRPMAFAERRLLLSVALDLEQEQIFNHRGSPHHGEPSLGEWTEGFFEPLVRAARIDAETLCRPGPRNVVLVVAIKEADRRDYRRPGLFEHFSDVLKARYGALSVIDLFAISAETRKLSAYSGSVISEQASQQQALTPVGLFADLLLRRRPEASLTEYEDALRRVKRELQSKPCTVEELEAAAPELRAR